MLIATYLGDRILSSFPSPWFMLLKDHIGSTHLPKVSLPPFQFCSSSRESCTCGRTTSNTDPGALGFSFPGRRFSSLWDLRSENMGLITMTTWTFLLQVQSYCFWLLRSTMVQIISSLEGYYTICHIFRPCTRDECGQPCKPCILSRQLWMSGKLTPT